MRIRLETDKYFNDEFYDGIEGIEDLEVMRELCLLIHNFLEGGISLGSWYDIIRKNPQPLIDAEISIIFKSPKTNRELRMDLVEHIVVEEPESSFDGKPRSIKDLL